jgi:hypothetical protein
VVWRRCKKARRLLITAAPTSPASSRISKLAQASESFGSFLQKRTDSSFSEEKKQKDFYSGYVLSENPGLGRKMASIQVAQALRNLLVARPSSVDSSFGVTPSG